MGKSKWDTHVKPYLDEIPKLIRQGRREEDIAKLYGVAVSTFNLYKTQHSELLDALKKGKVTLLEDLEDTMYMKALGGKKIDRIKTTYKFYKGKRIVDKEEVNTEITQPDNTCLIASLKRLSPEWRTALNNNVELKVQTDDLVTVINDLPVEVNDESD